MNNVKGLKIATMVAYIFGALPIHTFIQLAFIGATGTFSPYKLIVGLVILALSIITLIAFKTASYSLVGPILGIIATALFAFLGVLTAWATLPLFILGAVFTGIAKPKNKD
jgi:hypothetical protein